MVYINLLKRAVVFLVCWTVFCILIRTLYLYFKKGLYMNGTIILSQL